MPQQYFLFYQDDIFFMSGTFEIFFHYDEKINFNRVMMLSGGEWKCIVSSLSASNRAASRGFFLDNFFFERNLL